MLITQREAREILTAAGLGSGRHALRLLKVGLAGTPVRTRSALLYDAEKVGELAARRRVSGPEWVERCPHGWFEARREIAASEPRPEQLERLASGWQSISPYTWMALGLHLKSLGAGVGLPFVATVSGFVVVGAEVVGLDPGRRLVLAEPGAWFTGLETARMPARPGRSWEICLGG